MSANIIKIISNVNATNNIPPRSNIKNASNKLSFSILSLTKPKKPTTSSLHISNVSFMPSIIVDLTFHNELANQQND